MDIRCTIYLNIYLLEVWISSFHLFSTLEWSFPEYQSLIEDLNNPEKLHLSDQYDTDLTDFSIVLIYSSEIDEKLEILRTIQNPYQDDVSTWYTKKQAFDEYLRNILTQLNTLPSYISDLQRDIDICQTKYYNYILLTKPTDGVDEGFYLVQHVRYKLECLLQIYEAYVGDVSFIRKSIDAIDELLHRNISRQQVEDFPSWSYAPNILLVGKLPIRWWYYREGYPAFN